ncbi:MAG: heat shock protein DnaJ protein [uncultured bacterium]|nr:MAG: heat shock protein DnaJ protein [uncultured bacterium]
MPDNYDNLLYIESIDNRIRLFLESQNSPIHESILLQHIFPDVNISGASFEELYENHFILFNRLYSLQDLYKLQKKHLHADFRYIFLSDYPARDLCVFYHESKGIFCSQPCVLNNSFCSNHRIDDENSLEILSVKYFYLDQNNLRKTTPNIKGNFNETLEIIVNYEQYKKSFMTLGINETSDLNVIKNTFKKLAKIYHPDTCSDKQKFIEINSAYSFLVKLIKTNSDSI